VAKHVNKLSTVDSITVWNPGQPGWDCACWDGCGSIFSLACSPLAALTCHGGGDGSSGSLLVDYFLGFVHLCLVFSLWQGAAPEASAG